MLRTNNIFLVGPMGAGKTTIGRQLARALGCEFVDSDTEITRRTGADIPLIFELEGEEGFRKREKAVIDDLTQKQNMVLATGGGAILDADNRRYLGGRGFVIYLCTSIDQQVQRTSRDKNRPLLQTDDPRGRLEELMAARDPLYREIADLVVETDGNNVKKMVKFLVDKLREQDIIA